MEVYKLTGSQEFYAFYVGKEHEIVKLPKERHYLISRCAEDFIAFTSPKFTRDKSGEWLFCSLIKRLPHFMVLERETL